MRAIVSSLTQGGSCQSLVPAAAGVSPAAGFAQPSAVTTGSVLRRLGSRQEFKGLRARARFGTSNPTARGAGGVVAR